MRNNDNIIFIDHKGVSHNARVQSFREHRDAKDALIHHEPLVTLNYNGGTGGEPITLIDVPHISHPSRQENNPDLPSYPLHAWKREEEEHLEIPADHPVHDHFNEQPTRDQHGNIVPKRRPLHEAHIAAHRATFPEEHRAKIEADHQKQNTLAAKQRENDPVYRQPQHYGEASPLVKGTGPKPPVGSAAEAALNAGMSVGHPAHPETVKFPFECASCGASVTRTASHHGGKQWEQEILANCKLDPPGTGVSAGPWQEHVCKQEDIDAFRKKIEDAKKPAVVEPSAAERLAAGEQLAPEPTPIQKTFHAVAKLEDAIIAAVEGKPEPDVIAELEKAPPAPSETENKPEDAA